MNFKKTLAVVICLIMMISCMTVAASAATASKASVSVGVEPAQVVAGDTATFTVYMNAESVHSYACVISISGELELVGNIQALSNGGFKGDLSNGNTVSSIGNENGAYTGTVAIASIQCKVNGEGTVSATLYPVGEEYDEMLGKIKIDLDPTFGSKTIIPSCNHAYDAVVTAPTCTEKGYTTFTCSKCGDSYVADYVDANGHDMKETTAAVAPTCEKAGSKAVSTCTVCGYKEGGEEVAATGHDMKETAAKVDPKCDVPGKTAVFTCANGCGKTEGGEEIAALKHNWTDVKEKPATCTEDGVESGRFCDLCGKAEGQGVIAALGHDYEGKVTKEPTCEDKGVKTYTCKNDASHTYTEEIAALGHAWDDGVVTKEPTCTKTGVKTYTCKNDDSHTKTEDIAALGHDVEPAKYGKDGTDHWLICNVCGEIVAGSKEKHSFIEDKNDGYLYCECGAKTEKKVDNKDDEPKNGDITPYFVMPVVLVSVCAAAAYVTIKRKNAR